MNQFCDKCGSQINQTTGTCPNCAPNQVAVNGGAQTKAKKPMNKKAIILGAIAVVVAFSIVLGIGGILGYVIGKSGNNLPDSYNEIVERYKLVMAGGEDDEKTLSNKLIDKIKESENYEVCYSLTDINDDDVDELIVGGCFEDDKNAETYDIYTMDASGKAEQVFDVNSFSENTEITIYNEVIKVTEEDDDYLRFTYNVLPEKECIVKVDEEYYKEDDKYYVVIHNETTEDEKAEISEETFEEADNKYEGEELDLEWVKIVLEEDKKDKDTKPQSGAYIDVKTKRQDMVKNAYGFAVDCEIEIPQIYGEENEEITRINNEIKTKIETFSDGIVKKNYKYDYYCNVHAYPTSTDRYLNLTYMCGPTDIKFNNFSDTCSAIFSQVYDKQTGKELTIEEAYQMAGTSEQEIKADVKESMLNNDDIYMEEFTVSSVAFRMLSDGTPQFLINAYTYSEYWLTQLCSYTWTNGEAEYREYGHFIDFDEIDGEYSCGKLRCQDENEHTKKVREFQAERENGTATLVIDASVPEDEYGTRIIFTSKNTFCLNINLLEGYGYVMGDYTRLSDGSFKCTVTDSREIQGWVGEELSGFTITPISDSKYKIDFDNIDHVGNLTEQNIFTNYNR